MTSAEEKAPPVAPASVRRRHQSDVRDGFVFGRHLILDLYGISSDKLEDASFLASYVETLIYRINMVAYGEMIIEHFGHDDPRTAGYTVAQLIETSLVSMHLSPHLGAAYIDIFSCREFDVMDAMEFTELMFGATETVWTMLRR